MLVNSSRKLQLVAFFILAGIFGSTHGWTHGKGRYYKPIVPFHSQLLPPPQTAAAYRSPVAASHPMMSGIVPQLASRPVVVYGVGPHQSPPVIQNNYAGLASLMNKFNPLLSYGLPGTAIGQPPNTATAPPVAAPSGAEVRPTTYQPPLTSTGTPSLPVITTTAPPKQQQTARPYNPQPSVTVPPVPTTGPPVVSTAPPTQPAPTAPPPTQPAPTAPSPTLPVPTTTVPPPIVLPVTTAPPPVVLQVVTTAPPSSTAVPEVIAPTEPQLTYPSRLFYSMTSATTTASPVTVQQQVAQHHQQRPDDSLPLESATESSSVPESVQQPIQQTTFPTVDSSVTDPTNNLGSPAASWSRPPFTNWPSSTSNGPSTEPAPSPTQQPQGETTFDPYNRSQWPQAPPSHFQVQPILTVQSPQQPFLQWTSGQLADPVPPHTTVAAVPVEQPNPFSQWASSTVSQAPVDLPQTFPPAADPFSQWTSGPFDLPQTLPPFPVEQQPQFLLTPIHQWPSSTPSVQAPFDPPPPTTVAAPISEDHQLPPATPIPDPPLAELPAPITSTYRPTTTSSTPELSTQNQQETTASKKPTPAKAAMKPYFRPSNGKQRPFNKPSVATTTPSGLSSDAPVTEAPSTTQKSYKSTKMPRPKPNPHYKTTPASLAPTTHKPSKASYQQTTTESFQPPAIPPQLEPVAEVLNSFAQTPSEIPQSSEPQQVEIQKTSRPSYQRPSSTTPSTTTTSTSTTHFSRPSYQRPPSPPPSVPEEIHQVQSPPQTFFKDHPLTESAPQPVVQTFAPPSRPSYQRPPSPSPSVPEEIRQEIVQSPPQTFFNDHPLTESSPQPVVQTFFHHSGHQDSWASTRPPQQETRTVYISQSHPESLPSPPRSHYVPTQTAAPAVLEYNPLISGHQAFAHLTTHQHYGGGHSAIPGEPGVDYPIYDEMPQTAFKCSEQRLPGYYADMSSRCQMFHVCWEDRQWSFLCPNGTVFSQRDFVCVWWHQFDCAQASSLYDLNAKLYVVPPSSQYGPAPSEHYVKQSRTLDVSGGDPQNVVEPLSLIPEGYHGNRLVNKTMAKYLLATAGNEPVAVTDPVEHRDGIEVTTVVYDPVKINKSSISSVSVSELLMSTQDEVVESTSLAAEVLDEGSQSVRVPVVVEEDSSTPQSSSPY